MWPSPRDPSHMQTGREKDTDRTRGKEWGSLDPKMSPNQTKRLEFFFSKCNGVLIRGWMWVRLDLSGIPEQHRGTRLGSQVKRSARKRIKL